MHAHIRILICILGKFRIVSQPTGKFLGVWRKPTNPEEIHMGMGRKFTSIHIMFIGFRQIVSRMQSTVGLFVVRVYLLL